ncbi:hypothetical protein EV702DRAFT_1216978 [Suillus placidus]|uniref:NADP-dependent oxidoreductase domain-containing protein n=1 Tax=Suillus placidus TaxID=48579 RepID=A0A9P7CUZ0_9AGAM|nr:hypothetical protein EV702DRAFT_1216978 [Suillus placidus]
MAKYPTRKIGTDDISAISFGAMGIGAYYECFKVKRECHAVLDKAYELGCTFWDTANIYGDSKELIGKWKHQESSLEMPGMNNGQLRLGVHTSSPFGRDQGGREEGNRDHKQKRVRESRDTTTVRGDKAGRGWDGEEGVGMLG